MKIGEVIRKYRKIKQMTQEEMANCLGVTTPAVNKWENGNTMPDITLLAPIARLLGISLDELLSFQNELTTEEIQKISKEAEQKFSTESYDVVLKWVKEQIRIYPNCEPLIYNLVVQLDGQRLIQQLPNDQECEKYILDCYQRLLKSNDESIRISSANSLYIYYFRNEDYKEAEKCLDFFSKQNPERKRKQAVIYEKTGNLQKAFQVYEEILMAEYQILYATFNNMFISELKNQHIEKAQYYIEKMESLAQLFEMGDFHIYASKIELIQAQKDCDQTLHCMRKILDNIDNIAAFTKAPLYAHMTFKENDPTFGNTIKQNLLDTCYSDESFEYMRNDPRWEELLSNY